MTSKKEEFIKLLTTKYGVLQEDADGVLAELDKLGAIDDDYERIKVVAKPSEFKKEVYTRFMEDKPFVVIGGAGSGKAQIIKQGYEEFRCESNKELAVFYGLTKDKNNYNQVDKIIETIKMRKKNNTVVAAILRYDFDNKISQHTLLDLLDIIYFVGDLQESWDYIKNKYLAEAESHPCLDKFLRDSSITPVMLQKLCPTNRSMEKMIAGLATIEDLVNEAGSWEAAHLDENIGETVFGHAVFMDDKLLNAVKLFLKGLGCPQYKN